MKKENRKEEAKKAPIEIVESPDYKPVYATGVFGGLDPNSGRVIFFLDRIKPKMKKNPRGGMEMDRIERQLQVEIHMSASQFASVAKWMMDHVQRVHKSVKAGKESRAADQEQAGASYIG